MERAGRVAVTLSPVKRLSKPPRVRQPSLSLHEAARTILPGPHTPVRLGRELTLDHVDRLLATVSNCIKVLR